MKTIEREELKNKLDSGEDFKLVMTLSEWAYNAKHIHGSMFIPNPQECLERLDREEEIILYCSNETCIASITAYKTLENNNYTNIRRFSGGLLDWEQAGYPLDGEMVEPDRSKDSVRRKA